MYVQNDQRLTDYGDKLIKLEEFLSIWGTNNTRPLQMSSWKALSYKKCSNSVLWRHISETCKS